MYPEGPVSRMNGRGEVGPQLIIGTILTIVATVVVAQIGFVILSPLANRCPKSEEFTSACASITDGSAFALASSVGPGPIILVLLIFLAGLTVTKR